MRLLAICLCAAALSAQRGDRRGQAQPDLPKDLKVPAAPVLTPAQGLLSLHVQAGFRVELVASEPLIEDPVCVSFDEKGRLWVVEMRGFMPDVDGKGELEPNGRVVVLADTDGDGVMDTSKVFLDKLVLPRLVSVLNSGVLVLEPPQLLLCKDKDGDGVCDERTVIRSGLPGRSGPEHAINGGMVGLDNWIQFAKFAERLRLIDGKWTWRRTVFRGQWGITRDDFGRAFHNSNSDYLRGDWFPAHYAAQNRHLGRGRGANEQIAGDQSTWPIRITPGINRGYMKHMLRDFKLARFTAACAPVIYRDDVFPADCRGDAFVCEPAGNFVRRARVVRDGVRITARNAYAKAEFLASTDERFRPVDLKVGPDGGLYVVDMYRGILQHRNYVTTFLRRQILARKLDRPVGLGRIYRVLPVDTKRRKDVDLARATDRELVVALGHPSGWRRDQAQRLLIGRGQRVAGLVIAHALRSPKVLARIHALWVLEGLDQLGIDPIRMAMLDPHPEVRCVAIRLSEPFLAGNDPLIAEVRAKCMDPDERVVLQAIHSLSCLGPEHLISVTTRPMDELRRHALLSGLEGRELEFLESFAKAARDGKGGRAELVLDLVRCILKENSPARLGRLLEDAAPTGWWQDVARQEIAKRLTARSKRSKRPRVLALAAEPKALAARAGQDAAARQIYAAVSWPGRLAAAKALPPLSAAAKKILARGKVQYTLRCFACHGMTGTGQPGVAPPLVDSPWILGTPKRLVPIVTHGLKGPILVQGEEWDLLMPPVPELSDADAARILSYVRNSWGHRASLIDAATVRRLRQKHKGRSEPFTVAELKKIKE